MNIVIELLIVDYGDLRSTHRSIKVLNNFSVSIFTGKQNPLVNELVAIEHGHRNCGFTQL